MCDRPLMEFYVENNKRLEVLGATFLSFKCPHLACGKEIKTASGEPGAFYTPLSTCPYCEQFYWKIVQQGRACGMAAIQRSSTVRAVGYPVGPLAIPLPNTCTDHYAAGWAYVDGYLRRGGDLAAVATNEWPEEKANGLWDRLAAERQLESTVVK